MQKDSRPVRRAKEQKNKSTLFRKKTGLPVDALFFRHENRVDFKKCAAAAYQKQTGKLCFWNN